ncbi:hypothetical protein Leryth_000164 [Lithospermum erythrorhizon]|nr:hypothetical protein Leryth_000164 [Lithospermum erythrorhizon]
MPKKKNPLVFLEISFDGISAGRIDIELFADTVPKTAENFRALCTGEWSVVQLGKRLSLQGMCFPSHNKRIHGAGWGFHKRKWYASISPGNCTTVADGIYCRIYNAELVRFLTFLWFAGTGGESIYGGKFPDEKFQTGTQ